MHDLRIRLMLRWAFFALPFQMRQCKRSTSATITAFAGVVQNSPFLGYTGEREPPSFEARFRFRS